MMNSSFELPYDFNDHLIFQLQIHHVNSHRLQLQHQVLLRLVRSTNQFQIPNSLSLAADHLSDWF